MDYINEEEDDETDINFYELINSLKKQEILQNSNTLREFLILINKISKNYHRYPNFINKIEKILFMIESNIKQTFSNIEIFEIFKYNKRILLSLIHKKILDIDESVINSAISKSDSYSTDFLSYFFNEIKEKVSPEMKNSIENQLLKMDKNIFNDFTKKCQEGENDSYLCSLIRQDSIDEFVKLVNKRAIPLSNYIEKSIFETNPFLMFRNIQLIEYAAFYGSIQIFQYLKLNNVEMEPSLWLFAIHSKNAELLHLLESYLILPEDKTYEDCFVEAIKCHHNDIANYFYENFLKKKSTNFSHSKIIRYYNYCYFNNVFNERFPFYFLYRFKHYEIVNLYFKMNKNIFEKLLEISNFFIFLILRQF